MAIRQSRPYQVTAADGETLSAHTTYAAAERTARRLANERQQPLKVAVEWGRPERPIRVEPEPRS